MLLLEHNISYARLADIFLFVGLSAEKATKRRCIAGLESLLQINSVGKQLLEKIYNNLRLLGSAEGSSQKYGKSTDDVMEIRKRVMEIFAMCPPPLSTPLTAEAARRQESVSDAAGQADVLRP